MKIQIFNRAQLRKYFSTVVCFGLFFLISQDAMASSTTLGNMASSIIGSFESVTKLITAGAYIAGIGFAIGAIMKFKAHKDNPTQITIGQPIGLLLVGAALLFLPSILSVAGLTMFGEAPETAGPSGTVFTSGGS